MLAAFQSLGYAYLFKRQNALEANSGRVVIIVITLTAGTALLMWMGELITKRGVGNGISIIIFASIIADAPTTIRAWVDGGPTTKLFFPIVFLAVTVAVVFIQEGQRNSDSVRGRGRAARHVRWLHVHAAAREHGGRHPDHLRGGGAFPPTIAQFFPQTQDFINDWFSPTDVGFLMFEAFLIILFTYFYTAVQFNPIDQADNLRKHGGYIPASAGPADGAVPRPRADAADAAGSIYLALVAVIPTFLIQFFSFSSSTQNFLGGTSLLIMVGVALDTMRQMESQMMMRSYEGFLK